MIRKQIEPLDTIMTIVVSIALVNPQSKTLMSFSFLTNKFQQSLMQFSYFYNFTKILLINNKIFVA